MLGLVFLKEKIIHLWSSSDHLGQQVARGGVLIFVTRFGVKGLHFLRTVILARMLFPSDFGVYGLATLALSVTQLIFQTGFGNALVQEKDSVRRHLDSAWTYNFLRNVVIAAVTVFVSAPLAASFFHNDSIAIMIRVLAIGIIFEGMENFGSTLLQRELKFNRRFFFDILTVFVEVAAVLIAAFTLRNVWALVVGSLVGRLAGSCFAYIFYDYRPRFSFDLAGARHLFKFGKWVWVLAIVSFLVGQGDYLTIGKLLTPSDLGIYQLAFALGILPAVEFARVLGTVLFPMFAKIQADHERLRRNFIRSTRMIFSVTIPASVGLLVLSSEVVRFVYGERWLGMVPILHVILLFSFLKSFDLIASPLFMGIGKPNIPTIVLVVQSVVMFLLIVPLTNMWGTVGTAWAVFAGSLVAQGLSVLMMRAYIGLGIRGFIEMVALPMVASVVMGAFVYGITILVPITNVGWLLGAVTFGVVVYAALLYSVDRVFDGHYRDSLLWIKHSL